MSKNFFKFSYLLEMPGVFHFLIMILPGKIEDRLKLKKSI